MLSSKTKYSELTKKNSTLIDWLIYLFGAVFNLILCLKYI